MHATEASIAAASEMAIPNYEMTDLHRQSVHAAIALASRVGDYSVEIPSFHTNAQARPVRPTPYQWREIAATLREDGYAVAESEQSSDCGHRWGTARISWERPGETA